VITYLEVVLEVVVEVGLARELLHEGGRELLELPWLPDVGTWLRLVGAGVAAWRSLHVGV
jgi:hypothetical protein